jgi:hypothetical protein
MSDKMMAFFERRLSEEMPAARSPDPAECPHRQLANDYARVVAAYRNLPSSR